MSGFFSPKAHFALLLKGLLGGGAEETVSETVVGWRTLAQNQARETEALRRALVRVEDRIARADPQAITDAIAMIEEALSSDYICAQAEMDTEVACELEEVQRALEVSEQDLAQTVADRDIWRAQAEKAGEEASAMWSALTEIEDRIARGDPLAITDAVTMIEETISFDYIRAQAERNAEIARRLEEVEKQLELCGDLCGKAEARLTKWEQWRPEDGALAALKEQAENSQSLAAKQAYINGLEWHLQNAERAELEREEQLQRKTKLCISLVEAAERDLARDAKRELTIVAMQSALAEIRGLTRVARDYPEAGIDVIAMIEEALSSDFEADYTRLDVEAKWQLEGMERSIELYEGCLKQATCERDLARCAAAAWKKAAVKGRDGYIYWQRMAGIWKMEANTNLKQRLVETEKRASLAFAGARTLREGLLCDEALRQYANECGYLEVFRSWRDHMLAGSKEVLDDTNLSWLERDTALDRSIAYDVVRDFVTWVVAGHHRSAFVHPGSKPKPAKNGEDRGAQIVGGAVALARGVFELLGQVEGERIENHRHCVCCGALPPKGHSDGCTFSFLLISADALLTGIGLLAKGWVS